MIAPIVADFTDLEALDVVVGAQKRVHVGVKTLQVIDRRGVELDLNEVLRVR